MLNYQRVVKTRRARRAEVPWQGVVSLAVTTGALLEGTIWNDGRINSSPILGEEFKPIVTFNSGYANNIYGSMMGL